MSEQEQPHVPIVRDISRGAKLGIACLLFLVLLVGAGNLLSSYEQNRHTKAEFAAQEQAQRQQGQLELAKLCSTFGKLAALKPPPGSAGANPSRAYEQAQHDILAGVVEDIGCP